MDKTAVLLKYEGILIKKYDERRKHRLNKSRIEKAISDNSTDALMVSTFRSSLPLINDVLSVLQAEIDLIEPLILDIRNIHSLT